MAIERVQRRIGRLLDQAEEAMDRLDWESVRNVAKVVLGLDPENRDLPKLCPTRNLNPEDQSKTIRYVYLENSP